MKTPFLAGLALVLTTACASHEGRDTSPEQPTAPQPEVDPEPDPEPEPEPKQVTPTFTISSVQLIADCPQDDPVPEPSKHASRRAPAKPGVAMQGAASELADSTGWRQPCTQSTMQVAFGEENGADAKVVIKEIRLLDADKKQVATLASRLPTAWRDGSYTAWDELLKANGQLKASYRISVPDWFAVEKTMGKSSYGHLFSLEVVAEIGGKTVTARSADIPREEEHVVVT